MLFIEGAAARRRFTFPRACIIMYTWRLSSCYLVMFSLMSYIYTQTNEKTRNKNQVDVVYVRLIKLLVLLLFFFSLSFSVCVCFAGLPCRLR